MQRGISALLVGMLLVVVMPVSLAFAAQPEPDQTGTWTLFTNINPPQSTVDLGGIAMASATNGWISGDAGVILHYNGTSWNQENTGTSSVINAISTVPGTTDQAWAVVSAQQILHRTASGWSITNIGNPGIVAQLDGVDFVSTTNGWVVGDQGYIFHYNGTTWNQEGAGVTTAQLHSVAMFNSTEGWAVGNNDGTRPVIVHRTAAGWARDTNVPASTAILYMVTTVGPDDAWASGTGGTILHWTRSSGQWVATSVPNTNLYWAISMVTPTSGWGVSDQANIIYYNGSQWSIKQTVDKGLYFVRMVNANEGWATGRQGTVWHYTGFPTNLTVRARLPFIVK